MAKYDYISGLSDFTMQKVTKNADEWRKYLDTASRLYRYPFEDQILIYAQRPDATAAASMDTWNNRMYCWVNKSAKGIALLDNDGEKHKLKYVFDVSDVHKSRGIGRLPSVWEMKDEQKDDVIKRLEQTYGETNDNLIFEERIVELAGRIAQDYVPDIIDDLKSVQDDSFLYGLDDINLNLRLRETLASSIAYTVLSRCGADEEFMKDEIEFPYLTDFNTPAALTVLGDATSEMSEPVLMDICRTVEALDRNHVREAARAHRQEHTVEDRFREQNTEQTKEYESEMPQENAPNFEKNDSQSPTIEKDKKVLANDSEGHYNALKHESKNANNISEGGHEHGDYIQERRGLSDPESGAFSGAGGSAYEVRNAERDISEGAPQGTVQRKAPVGDTQGTLSDDSASGRGESRSDHQEPDGERGRDGGVESSRPDGMGTLHEFDQEPGGRDRSFGDRLQPLVEVKYEQLSFFPSLDEQMGDIRAAEADMKIHAPAAFSLSEEQLNDILRAGGGMTYSTSRIYEKYTEDADHEKMTEFLKREYGTCGKGFDMDGHDISVWFNEDGMTAGYGKSAFEHTLATMDWNEIEERISGMVHDGTYISDIQAFAAEQVVRDELANNLYFFFRDSVGELPDSIAEIDKFHSAPETMNGIADMLATNEGRNELHELTAQSVSAIESEEITPRFRLRPSPDELLAKLEGFMRERVALPQQETVPVMRDTFITQDEIDSVLKRGSGFKSGKFRIYDKYEEGVERKEFADFLKHEYGTGGSSHAIIGTDRSFQDHDSKGLQISKGSIMEPYAVVTLRWDAVAKRIDQLIFEDKYLTEQEKAYYEERHGIDADLSEAIDNINAYSYREFEHEADFSDLSCVNLAYTEYYDEEHDREYTVEVNANLEDCSVHTFLDGYEVLTTQYDSLQEMNEKELQYLSFDALTEVDQDMLNERLMQVEAELGFTNEEESQEHEEPVAKLVTDENEEPIQESQVEVSEPTEKQEVAAEKSEESEIKGVSAEEPERSHKGAGRYDIYQLKDTPELRDYQFAGINELLNRNLLSDTYKEISPDNYDLVYSGDLSDVAGENQSEKLNSIFIKFNTAHPEDFTGHSLSVSDVVVFHEDGKDTAHFVDSYGFTNLPEFVRALEAEQNIETEQNEMQQPYKSEQSVQAEHESPEFTHETVAYYSGEENNLPYDIEIQTLHIEPEIPEPEQNEQSEQDISTAPAELTQDAPGNFHITDVDLGVGSPKEKFQRNIEAIKTLQTIEAEGRHATSDEQQMLSQYVGWGGLADAFDETKENWRTEFQELKGLLSDSEYVQARESTLNAHYTSPAIIDGIYDTLSRMGFESGNILEPSMGVGNFFGMLPDSMSESKLYGVELDSLTGRIAKELYPEARIDIKGFEETNYPNDFFDVAVGNVPFGQYKVNDKEFDKHNFLIHDYFFAKALDKVRLGGVIAFVTSKGTLDKRSESVRNYLAERAEFLGAVRLPNTAFKANAGTEVTSDIIFLKKRDRLVKDEPEWLHTGTDANGIEMNQYFINHPEQVVGHMEQVSGRFGMETACVADSDKPFKEALSEALSHIEGSFELPEVSVDELGEDISDRTLPADPDVKNFSYTVVDNEVYYRENSIMKPVDVPETKADRIRGMAAIRDCTRELIDMQMTNATDAQISDKQAELNQLYDDFVEKHGRINSRTNKQAYDQDSSYSLLCSLEKFDSDGNFKEKADMFTKRTIKRAEPVTSVDTASEALAVSLAERAKVDLDFMASLMMSHDDYMDVEKFGAKLEEIKTDLVGVIFKEPVTDTWQTADEYLSGNVREKLAVAEQYAEVQPEFAANAKALAAVLPKELDASEIEVRLGATWIKPQYYEDFMKETFKTPLYLTVSYGRSESQVGVQYSDATGLWNVRGKNADRSNPLANATYGTQRMNAYKILEESLNLKDCRVYDTITENGKEKRVLNKKETMLASQKQETLREAFKNWIFENPERRQDVVHTYNEIFNSVRPREYDGAHLKFPGMSPEITLRPHQLNAIAHQLYGKNTLLAHCVGAGKTWEMTAAAMESKRLGLCRKSLFVVPNHLTEQWGSEFLQLYPGANILVANKKDFEPANRKKFCSRIATGDYDAVIIGHTQFEKIPLSKERQAASTRKQIDNIENEIALAKAEKGERYSIKEMEKSRKNLKARLEKLNDDSRKDDVVTFEQLGVDRLFVDESHSYKNLFLYTKMRNVAGIAQTEAQKSSDMFMKCQYMDELTGGTGVTFATGTPISNSMTELYTNMRYLQYGTLDKMGLSHFDSWASAFGESQTAIELAPEGTGYRAKTRFAKFFNLPELISLFKEAADIQTPDMLHLDVPEVTYENIALKPSEFQQDMVKELAERAEVVRNGGVDPSVDNMLKITNDGRKLALDQRLVNDMLPDDENSKTTVCVEKAMEIYNEEAEHKGAQLIFCDLSTPKNDGTFNVYDDIKTKLMGKGVPESEIAFIHDANTETKKADLFAKVRSGEVRFLLGSTAKMGAGTNVQDRLCALHHLDVPWRPSDIEQQEGRIIRQGNMYKELGKPVKIFRYVTEGTFDAYSWQVIENKQKFIGQIMTSKSPVRSCDDVDEAALTYAEVKALCTGNPYIKEKMDLDVQVSKLKLLKANHTSQRYRLEDAISQTYPKQIASLTENIKGLKADAAMLAEHKEELAARQEKQETMTFDTGAPDKETRAEMRSSDDSVKNESGKDKDGITTGDKQTDKGNKEAEKEPFEMKLGSKVYTERKEAGAALINICKEMKHFDKDIKVGEYMGFQMLVLFDMFEKKFDFNLKGSISHHVSVGSDPSGNITRINNALAGITHQIVKSEEKLTAVQNELATAKVEVTKPFEKEAELAEKLDRLNTLNALLNMDEKGDEKTDRDHTVESDRDSDVETDRDSDDVRDTDEAVAEETSSDRQTEEFEQADIEKSILADLPDDRIGTWSLHGDLPEQAAAEERAPEGEVKAGEAKVGEVRAENRQQNSLQPEKSQKPMSLADRIAEKQAIIKNNQNGINAQQRSNRKPDREEL